MDELHIHMGSRRVGVLEGSDRRSLSFTYDDAWVDDPAATPLSLSLPKRRGPYGHAALTPYLWGLLPDNDRVIDRWAREYRCSPGDVFALLTHVGIDVAGAASYLAPDADPEEALAPTYEDVDDDAIAVLLREVRRDATAWHAGSRRWSLAGAQAKIALALDPGTGRWTIPGGSAPTTHILKPAIAGLDDHDLNEHLCLATAELLGLRAAASEVRTFGDERALVVQRYDRSHRTDGSIVRVHQEDFCQALGVRPDQKYEADGGPGVRDLTTLLRNATDDRREVERLALAVAFNWLVLGIDAHAKNYSLLLSGEQVRLAPLYDIASGAPTSAHPARERLAQKLGGEYRATRIGRRHLARLADQARVDEDALVAQVRALGERLPDAMADAIGASDLTAEEAAAGRAIQASIASWTARCTRQLDLEAD